MHVEPAHNERQKLRKATTVELKLVGIAEIDRAACRVYHRPLTLQSASKASILPKPGRRVIQQSDRIGMFCCKWQYAD